LCRNELQWRELLNACPRPFHTATQDCLGEPLHRIKGRSPKIPDNGHFPFIYLEKNLGFRVPKLAETVGHTGFFAGTQLNEGHSKNW
jgi:hypothetical protein